MAYTVQKLAQMASISVRTLHFYDKIGLLKPSYVKSTGYRYYEEKELIQLQQILFFRELEFSLKDIQQILSSPHFDPLEALQAQEKMLDLKKARLERLSKTLINTITSMKKKKIIKGDQLYDAFSDEQQKEYQKEAKERWGHTEAYKQSQERTKNWTPQDYKRVQEEGGAILLEIVKHMDKGPESEEVQREIPKYHKHIGTFYDCSHEMFRCLGDMYSQDPRFAAFYEKIHEGLAVFMTKAINHYCDQHRV